MLHGLTTSARPFATFDASCPGENVPLQQLQDERLGVRLYIFHTFLRHPPPSPSSKMKDLTNQARIVERYLSSAS